VESVENRPGTTLGGITGRGFTPGVSGNPGGRPKGLARRVRELVGENGESIAAFMFGLMTDSTARNADRIEAAKWLGDRGFGRSIQGVDLSVNQVTLEDLFRGMATEDLDLLVELYDRSGVLEMVEAGEVSHRGSLSSLGP
jgi:hypothetical protein